MNEYNQDHFRFRRDSGIGSDWYERGRKKLQWYRIVTVMLTISLVCSLATTVFTLARTCS